MNSVIFGAGVSGSLFSHLSGFTVYEKARYPGGRTSHSISTGAKYDFGATILHKNIYLKKSDQIYSISLSKFIKKFASKLTLSDIRGMDDKFYLQEGVNKLCVNLLQDRQIFTGYKVSRMIKIENQWKVEFENKKSILTENCIMSFPLPQSLAVLPDGTRKLWEDLLGKRTEYRPCLTLTGIWRKGNPEMDQVLQSLKQTTFLNKQEDMEYFSVESEKYSGDYHVILIQFSESFSEMNFEGWMMEGKIPGPIALALKDRFFQKIFQIFKISYLPPEEIKVHRWKYSSPKETLFGQADSIQINEDWTEYLEICKKEKIWLISDLIFGKRILHSVLGTLLVWEEFSGENRWLDLVD